MKLIKIILIIENRYCDFFIEELGDCEDCILFMLYKIIYFFFFVVYFVIIVMRFT